MAHDNQLQAMGSVPVPDPTVLTTQLLLREIAALRELLETKVNCLSEIVDERFGGMDKAIKLLQDINDRQPGEVDTKIENQRKLHQEKFDGIEKRFEDQKEALGTALQAAKEAVSEQNKSSSAAIQKSETSTEKQIGGLDSKITYIKERVDNIEGKSEGRGSLWAYITTGIAVLVGVLGAIFGMSR